ncbi:hypothetical protein IWQ47_002169 [Aquimarina sp. EL_43]|uniref:hypothetical protein n=1 Tax=Aquimarina TaxID=290174 RepID=UPI0004BA439F|nr:MULTISPECIES: hypothetical protein [Aquimarina]MBG6130693.1 hypothetical protein [Aquimarina sp. EL_35]MBG6151161.1 hypothetical protein [Aquimarina sp. EL_32]MBG6169095.1 hypothetical protein [Aquimarina sp. EL_43]
MLKSISNLCTVLNKAEQKKIMGRTNKRVPCHIEGSDWGDNPEHCINGVGVFSDELGHCVCMVTAR